MNDIPLCVTTKHAAKMAAKEVSKQPVAEQADAKQKTNNKLAEVVKNDFFRALVLIGVAAAFCAAFVSHMTKPSVASELAEIDHACPPQWLPVILASTALLSSSSQNSEFIRANDNSKPAKLSSSSRHDDDPSPNCGSADEIWPCWVKCHQQGGSTAEIRACKAANCPIVCFPPSPPPPSPPVTCADEDPHICQQVSSLQQQLTNCKQHPYREYCKLSCGYCAPATPMSPTPQSTPVVAPVSLATTAPAAETSTVSTTLIGGVVAAVSIALLACFFLASR